MPNIFDIPIDSECRHVISFTGYSGKVNISAKLKNFYRFVYNENGRRVSFVTAKNSNYNKLLTDRLFPTEIFSTDPEIKKFNQEFLQINKHIPFENITTYDMIADPADTKLWKKFKDQFGDFDVLPYLVFGSIFLFLWKMPNLSNKRVKK